MKSSSYDGNDVPVISLFSGSGSFDYGFRQSGFDVVLALDNDPIAVRTYNHNLCDGIAYVVDISKITDKGLIGLIKGQSPETLPRGIIGGAPCQTFSNSNVHFRPDDDRHHLPRRYAHILRVLNLEFDLDFFVFENVKGITSKRHQQEYRTIKRLFSTAGFKLFEGELDAVHFGVAQRRPRVFLVGLNKKRYFDFSFKFPKPETVKPLTVAEAIKGLPDPILFRRGLNKEEIPFHPNHWTMYPRSHKFYDGSLMPGNNKGRSFRVLDWNRPSWAVAYGNREIHIHPSGRRRLSVYEAMLLQGFPNSYELFGTLSDQIRQVSDAIPPQIGSALGQSIHSTLYSH